MGELKLPPRPAMGAVILPQAVYDDAKKMGMDLTGFIRAEPIPTMEFGTYEGIRIVAPTGTRQQRRAVLSKKAKARKKLARWAKRGGK